MGGQGLGGICGTCIQGAATLKGPGEKTAWNATIYYIHSEQIRYRDLPAGVGEATELQSVGGIE